jgi:hypothetical protein
MRKPTPFKIISDIVSKTDHPWEYEPDLYEWTHRGVECVARRNLTHGAWCGYVDVPTDAYEKLVVITNAYKKSEEEMLDVHGGVTYCALIVGRNVQRIGFDCAHGGDRLPKIPSGQAYIDEVFPQDIYRDLPFVIAECESMVDQILKVTGGSTPS